MIKIGPEGYFPVKATRTAKSIPTGNGIEKNRQADGCYDQLSLSKEDSDEARFIKEVTAKMSYQVRTNNTTGKIQELKRQVNQGEYQIDASEIAARMLLVGEEL